MKFYCIVDDVEHLKNPDSYRFLKKAAEHRDLEWHDIEAFKREPRDLSQLSIEAGSILYRLAISKRAVVAEALLFNDTLSTLYRTEETIFSRGFEWGSTIRQLKAGLPIIPTIFSVSLLHIDRLEAYAQELGGFPLILKSSGGSHGSAVMRLDSLESLKSVIGFITDPGSTQFVLRQYIDNARHIRCVVVGNTVVDAIEYGVVDKDFRTNAIASPPVKAFKKDEAIFQLAAKAVDALDIELGGVDILIDQEGVPYIAEVNFPCNFARNQMNTGADISGMIVDHLIVKSKAKLRQQQH
jgi:biotin carboxylase